MGINIKADDLAISNTVDLLSRGVKSSSVIRELWQNAADALERGGVSEDSPGTIIFKRDKEFKKKLVVVNSKPGDPLTRNVVRESLVALASSGHNKTPTSNKEPNFGIGAKIAYLPQHNDGLLYRCRAEQMYFTFHKNPQNIYGLKEEMTDDGTPACFMVCDDKKFNSKDSETEVVLMGNAFSDDTWRETCEAASHQKQKEEKYPFSGHTIANYLEQRYWDKTNPHITTRVNVYDSDNNEVQRLDNIHRRLIGTMKEIKEKQTINGTYVAFDGAKVHYYALNYQKGKKLQNRYPGGYRGYIYDNEVYIDRDISSGSRQRIMQECGISVCHKHVLILVELPNNKNYVVSPNRCSVTRTDGSAIPMSDYSVEFRENMPENLKEWMRSNYVSVDRDIEQEAARLFKAAANRQISSDGGLPTQFNSNKKSSSNTNNNNNTNNPSSHKRKRKKTTTSPTGGNKNSAAPVFRIERGDEDQAIISFPLTSMYEVVINTGAALFTYRLNEIKKEIPSAAPEKVIETVLSEMLYLLTCERFIELKEIYGKKESLDSIERRMSEHLLDSCWTSHSFEQVKVRINSALKASQKKQELDAA